jgi:NADH dehydrogenase (ubiquinone) Fe-S protein 4
MVGTSTTLSRSLATDSVSSPPEKKDTEIITPAQDVMVADVISGAPGADLPIHSKTLV